MPRYHFSEFVLSPRRRLLLRNGREEPLIPRYFDLLVFLVERRHEAVHRRDIFERVWHDVIVSDSALSQAIRTIRRTLGDDTREPRFIRTVSRHGYRFVFADVREEEDDGESPGQEETPSRDALEPPSEAALRRDPPLETTSAPLEEVDPFAALIDRLTRPRAATADDEDRREAAELLHALGTAEALERLGTRPGHAFARAMLRDARWDVPAAGPVPLVGYPGAWTAGRDLVLLRLRRAARIVAARWAAGSIGGALAGACGGSAGGLLLIASPGSAASIGVVPVLAFIGACCGGAGGAGVAAGLSATEAVVRSRRTLALVCGAAAGGGIAGLSAQWLARWMLTALVGVPLSIGGGLEGLVLGAASGLGFAGSTSRTIGGLAAPRGRQRWTIAAVTAVACGLGALALTAAGRPLVGGTIHLIAEASPAAQASLTPLARLIGEPEFGALTGTIIGTAEGALFGLGLALGLTRRP